MIGDYLGLMDERDPLYNFLSNEALVGVLGVECCHPIFDVYRLDQNTTNWSVYHYAERHTAVHLVGKFYGNKWLDDGEPRSLDIRARLMYREFDNLCRVRAMGFDIAPHQVVRPLVCNEMINCVLLEDYIPGHNLDQYISEAIHCDRGEVLRDRLKETASFLADLHNRSQTQEPVDAASTLTRLDKIIDRLLVSQIITPDQHRRLKHLRDQWADSHILSQGQQVLIHSDVKPPHFIFNGEYGVTVVDFEHCRSGDRAEDIGQLVAELKHRFFQGTGNLWASEAHIEHLYACYASYVPVVVDDFRAFTTRGRFYQGYFEARMGQNYHWLDTGYRRRLIEDAEACLNLQV